MIRDTGGGDWPWVVTPQEGSLLHLREMNVLIATGINVRSEADCFYCRGGRVRTVEGGSGVVRGFGDQDGIEQTIDLLLPGIDGR